MSINQERCYALSRMNMNRRDYIIYGDTNNNIGNLQQERNERYQKQEEQQRLIDVTAADIASHQDP